MEKPALNQPSHVMAALAKEREARDRAKAASSKPVESSPKVATAPPRQALPASCAPALKKAPRSVRLARTFGLGLQGVAALTALMRGPSLVPLFVSAGGILLARSGGKWLHGQLPPMLVEDNRPPSDADVAMAADLGLFSLGGLRYPMLSLSVEWEVALENIAFICTYGKRNCLTSQMYSGTLTLGKIVSLVWGKLSEGIVRC